MKILKILFEKFKTGVYISRQMTHAMNGKLFAKSPGKNKGSEFTLELPGIKENGGK